MARLIKDKKGITLLELLVAITLLVTVLLTASALLTSFRNLYVTSLQREGDIVAISSVVFEEIVDRLMFANEAVISEDPQRRIAIRVDENETPSDFDDDTIHTYWKEGDKLKYSYQAGGVISPEKVIAERITLLDFELEPSENPEWNRIKIIIGVTPEGGEQQEFDTVIVMRGRSAQRAE